MSGATVECSRGHTVTPWCDVMTSMMSHNDKILERKHCEMNNITGGEPEGNSSYLRRFQL